GGSTPAPPLAGAAGLQPPGNGLGEGEFAPPPSLEFPARGDQRNRRFPVSSGRLYRLGGGANSPSPSRIHAPWRDGRRDY
ncbi:MAG: hypothetical protein LBG25_03560, partial [Spirochaetaceae bacterium]|nr:hypothetical protein [Spirochaetaceae bacterium]